MNRKLAFSSCVVAVCVLAASSAFAQNLVLNGGFESGDFTDWNLIGLTTTGSVSTNSLYVHSGTFGAQLGSINSLSFLDQNLSTAPNQTYALSVWLDSPNGKTPNEFAISWNGTNIFDQTNISAIGWTNIVFTNLTATSASTPLLFSFQNNLSFFGLDDVIVTNTAPAFVSPAAYTFTTFAGFAGAGSADGVGGAAQFSSPGGIVVDQAGNAYVADFANFTIRKITPSGVVTTIAGLTGVSGTNDGIGSAARFGAYSLIGMAIDKATNLYVTEVRNNTIRKLSPVGTNWEVTTIAGSPEQIGTNDGTGNAILFHFPNGIVVDDQTNIYIADEDNDTIRRLTVAGTNWVSSTIAGMIGHGGTADGTNNHAQFYAPEGLALDTSGNLYVGDLAAIRKITPVVVLPQTTNWVVTTLAGTPGKFGFANGIGTNAQFTLSGLVLDSATNIYVADEGNNVIRKVSPTGTNWVATTFAGQPLHAGSTDATGTNASFGTPGSITFNSANVLYVTDSGDEDVRKITLDGIVTTLAGAATGPGSNNGAGADARFFFPSSITLDNAGNIYVADTSNNTIRVISAAGVASTPYGSAGSSGTNDGIGNNARFNSPAGIAVDDAGNIYVADTLNHSIRELTPEGSVSTIAGLGGTQGTNDGIGSAARFYQPVGITVDGLTNLYVADSGNFTIREITRVGSSNWMTSTIAGAPGSEGTNDGAGIGARFGGLMNHSGHGAGPIGGPHGITLDSAGNLYVADTGNFEIRKLTRTGSNWVATTISTSVQQPYGVAADSTGNIFVANDDETVQKLSPVGITTVATTIGGAHFQYGSQDGTGSSASFGNIEVVVGPMGIALDSAGNVYVTDTGNNTIRKGVFTQYGSANPTPYVHPTNVGALQVTLLPPEANGQWRFPWEQVWHDSGYTASNLVEGQYPVEFRNIPGWIAIPPNQVGTNSIAVSAGTLVQQTNFYFPTGSPDASGIAGSLNVYLGANPPAGAGWRFLGDTNAFFPSGFTTNLLPGTYLIEFAGPFSGRATPPNGSVQVSPGQLTQISVLYSIAPPPPANILLPTPVPAGEVSDVSDLPFGFNGQLQSDVGYSSGVVVASNVVLTAAHAIFNDQTLSYVSGAFFFFQEEVPSYAPSPEIARGWYTLSSYSSQRTNDVSTPPYGPGISSPQSRNFDVAALYFNAPVADGGFAGYLPSDNVPNQWLTGNAEKILVGYPQDGSIYGFTDITNGDMYEIGPQPYPLTLSADSVTNQQEVYDASWFLAYPGNSGGALYVQLNGSYYPAGIYLGTQNNQSVVRAIDSTVTNLIFQAASLGDSGTNHNGGGIVTFIPDAAISAFNPAYLQIQLQPPSAVEAGASWELQGDSTFASNPNFTRALTNTSAGVVFNPINGWNLPTNQNIPLTPGNLATVTAFYTVLPPNLVLNSQGVGLTGTTNTTYRIEQTTSLKNPIWTGLSTNTIVSTGFNLVVPRTNQTTTFYRAVWLGR